MIPGAHTCILQTDGCMENTTYRIQDTQRILDTGYRMHRIQDAGINPLRSLVAPGGPADIEQASLMHRRAMVLAFGHASLAVLASLKC